MIIEEGYLYHIKDEFFNAVKDKGLMINHENVHSRPSYLAIKDKEILWFIPLSSKITKYKNIIAYKKKKYGACKSIIIKNIAGKKQVILIQNAFPTIEKYIESKHYIDGKYIKVPKYLQIEILANLNYMLSKKKQGKNLFFADIDKIKNIMIEELLVKS